MRKTFLLLLLFPALAFAEVHKCMTDEGHVTYSEKPCVTGKVPYDSKLINVGDVASNSSSIVRGKNGSYMAVGFVNGHSVNFLIDTGANVTTLSASTAARSGQLKCLATGTTGTANGYVTNCFTIVSSLRVAGFEFSNVPVSIMPQMTQDALLGTDLLSHFSVTQRGGVMTLSRY